MLKKKILLVDDDTDHLEMLVRCFQRLGIDTVSAHGGRQAMEIVKENNFSIVISDINMPEVDGVELLHFIKKNSPSTDVVLITGYSDAYSFTDVIKQGATDYLEKPFVKDAIEAKVNRILRERSEIAYRKKIERELRQRSVELRESHNNLEREVLQRTKDLHVAQAELLTVFESVPDGIISVDNSMMIRHRNKQSMAKLSIETGAKFLPGTTSFQRECHRLLAKTIDNQEPVLDYRVELNRGEKNQQVFLLSTSCLFTKTEKLKGALLIIHDITLVVTLESQIEERRQSRNIVGESQKMQEIYQRIRQISSVDTTVLITGESGVGKELIVDTLHARGDRSGKPLVKVNCSALPENLLESELFGHVKGAFTGATHERKGRIQLAEEGILFLDEIGDISQRLQLKLLRFLESKEYEKVGESQKRTADVRIFTATNANLMERVNHGTFREDLYYRLKIMVINVPPLRERQEDIPLLVDFFLDFFNRKFNKQISGISQEALDALISCPWRGNVRELKHSFEHAFLLCQGTKLHLSSFPKDLFGKPVNKTSVLQPARTLTQDSLLEVLQQTHWHRTKTAKILKISRATLYNKIKEFGLNSADPL